LLIDTGKPRDTGKKGILWSSRLGVGVRLTTPPLKKIVKKPKRRRPRPAQGCTADDYGFLMSDSMTDLL